MAKSSNSNLLDNPWFTINQRGQTSYTSGYTIDRWTSDLSSVKINSNNSITLTANAKYRRLLEFISLNLNTGNTYTCSILLSDDTLVSTTGSISSTSDTLFVAINSDWYLQVMYNTDFNKWHINISSSSDSTTSISIKAVKLELGSTSTLANDSAPNYQLELYKCRTSTADSTDECANKKVGVTNLLNPILDTGTYSGLTITNNNDGTYTLNGTATETRLIYLETNISLKSGYYKLTGGSVLTGEPYLALYSPSTSQSICSNSEGDQIKEISAASDFQLYPVIQEGYTFNNVVIKPMLTANLNATYDDFVSYTGDTGTLNGDVAQLRKEMSNIGGGGMPSLDYSNPLYTFSSSNTSYTATQDCYAIGNSQYGTSNSVSILINNVTIYTFSGSSTFAGGSSIFLKLTQGDVMTISGSTGLIRALKVFAEK